VEIELKILTPA